MPFTRQFFRFAAFLAFLLPCREAPAEIASPSGDAFYFLINYGFRNVSSDDANHFFDPGVPGAPGPGFSSNWANVSDISLGFQTHRYFGIEAGFGAGPFRAYQVVFPAGPATVNVTTDWRIYDAYAMPHARAAFQGLGGKPAFHLLGLRLGSASLEGHIEQTSNYFPYAGSYDQRASAFSWGLTYRFEQMISERMAMGIEVGYQAVKLQGVSASNGQGFYFGWIGPDTTFFSGEPVYVDGSGITAKLILQGWFSAPMARPAVSPPPAEVGGPAVPGAQESAGLDPQLSEQYRKLGATFYAQKAYADAEKNFGAALAYNAGNAEAWKGLGNARYYQGKKAAALDAYKKALALQPENQALRNFIEALEKKGN